MSERRPRILDELGTELVRAARADEAAARWWQRRRRPQLGRAVALAVGAALLIAAGTVAASLVIGRGDPIAPAPPEQVPEELRPQPGSARLNGLAVPDPDGGPVWDVRTSRSATGAICSTVGQVLDGDFGLVGLDRRFRPLPAGAADTCSAPQTSGATLAGARAFRGGGRLSAITVVNGVAAPNVRTVVVVGAGRVQPLRLGPDHAFLAIFRGTPEGLRPRVTLTDDTGRRTTLRFADTGEYLAPDPVGDAPWTATATVEDDRRCVSVRRQRGPDSPMPLPPDSGMFNVIPASVPPRCGDRDVAFVSVRRFVPEPPKVRVPIWWAMNPARVVVWGAAPRAGATVRLLAPGPARDVPVDRRTGAFAVILDGHVDPRTVRLTVDGVALLPRAGADAPPPWRSVESLVRRYGIASPFRPVPATARVVHRAADPVVAGATWAQRSWRATQDPRIDGLGRDRNDLRCFQIGRVAAGGALVLEQPDGTARTVTPEDGDVFCNGRRWLGRHAAGPLVRVEVDDAASAMPVPQRAVVAGLLGPGVRSAELLGAGAPRALTLGPDGTFLIVLDGRDALASLQVRQTRDDGTVRTSRGDGLDTPCRLQPGRHVVVADPDGGAPWVAGHARIGERRCTFTGRIVAGGLAYINPADGTVQRGPGSFTSAPPGTRTQARGSSRALSVRIDSPALHALVPAAASRPTPAAQVARRSLPGRTLVTGHAADDVVSVTIRTPRDIRTVKPVGGLYLAVYDGAFYTGEIVVTGHRRDGTVVTARAQAPLG